MTNGQPPSSHPATCSPSFQSLPALTSHASACDTLQRSESATRLLAQQPSQPPAPPNTSQSYLARRPGTPRPRSRQIPDPSRPQRGIAPASVVPCRFRCVRATRLFARVWRRPASVQRHLFPLKRFPAKNSAVFSIQPQAQRASASFGMGTTHAGSIRRDGTASPCLPAVYIMPSRGTRVPCAGPWRRFARTSIRVTPSRDAATKPSGPTALVSPLAQSHHCPHR
ncbi:hypothetical protein B0H14DRAFT_841854 [Mycena olivaceomarginata]|nr:hypothetical protein B0H14DRAFT_841854 [Mycena olivaceomarginata]